MGIEFNEAAIFFDYMKIAYSAKAAILGQMVHEVGRGRLRGRCILHNRTLVWNCALLDPLSFFDWILFDWLETLAKLIRSS